MAEPHCCGDPQSYDVEDEECQQCSYRDECEHDCIERTIYQERSRDSRQRYRRPERRGFTSRNRQPSPYPREPVREPIREPMRDRGLTPARRHFAVPEPIDDGAAIIRKGESAPDRLCKDVLTGICRGGSYELYQFFCRYRF